VSADTTSASGEHAATVNTDGRIVDPVRGDHYGRMPLQPIDYILTNDLDFITGNIVKYVTRAALGTNGVRRREDMLKAQHYVGIWLEWDEKRGRPRV
jgi:uncharacterized protein DUF3310